MGGSAVGAAGREAVGEGAGAGAGADGEEKTDMHTVLKWVRGTRATAPCAEQRGEGTAWSHGT
nr:hypothetical protein StreXyl84_16930 [Streptomyces sp. Xyl84]